MTYNPFDIKRTRQTKHGIINYESLKYITFLEITNYHLTKGFTIPTEEIEIMKKNYLKTLIIYTQVEELYKIYKMETRQIEEFETFIDTDQIQKVFIPTELMTFVGEEINLPYPKPN